MMRRKEVSAVELAKTAIARIEALDGRVNAVVVRDFERALADAAAADQLRAKGEDRPLLGVPMTVKESFDLAGHPTTWGMEAHRDHRAARDSAVVEKLKSAGAVVLGKTNVPPVLADWQSSNPIYGRTLNPYDPTRSPGGSSGGSAAALAMGFCALEVGSDIGGSVRVPATFCGVFGQKTTYGIVPSRGHALAGATGPQPELAVIGPLGHSAEDVRLALSVIAGADPLEPPGWRLELAPPRFAEPKQLRVLVLDEHPLAPVASEIRAAIGEMAETLARAGAKVMRASPLLPNLGELHRLYQRMLQTIMNYRQPTQERPPISAHDWMDLLAARKAIQMQFAALFEEVDAVIAPAFSTVAFPHTDEPDWRKRTLDVDGRAIPYGSQLAWAGLATFANLPSTAAPLGLGKGQDAEGLPFGVQVIGPLMGDNATLAIAGMIAKPPPPPAA